MPLKPEREAATSRAACGGQIEKIMSARRATLVDRLDLDEPSGPGSMMRCGTSSLRDPEHDVATGGEQRRDGRAHFARMQDSDHVSARRPRNGNGA